MNEVIHLKIADILPEDKEVLSSHGIPSDKRAPQKVIALLEAAQTLLPKLAEPAAVIRDISISEFDDIFIGEGQNEDEAPLATIYTQADVLALYAVTLGEKVSAKIDDLFKSRDFALGMMLDSACSIAAENASQFMESYFLEKLKQEDSPSNNCSIMGYSPGYCGWHISAQRKLFNYLRPERINLFLNDSYLMQPLKSVSGVLVAGDREIHDFEASFTFCKLCKDRTCQNRLIRIMDQTVSN